MLVSAIIRSKWDQHDITSYCSIGYIEEYLPSCFPLNIYALVSCKKFLDGIHMCLIGCRCADDKPYAPSSRVSQEKAKSLVIHFTPLEVSLKDTVESLKEKNFVSFWLTVFTARLATKS